MAVRLPTEYVPAARRAEAACYVTVVLGLEEFAAAELRRMGASKLLRRPRLRRQRREPLGSTAGVLDAVRFERAQRRELRADGAQPVLDVARTTEALNCASAHVRFEDALTASCAWPSGPSARVVSARAILFPRAASGPPGGPACGGRPARCGWRRGVSSVPPPTGRRPRP